jgi:lipid II:glycine glycyltransferase (peptidoglycan interpeptide bridge formation enzyme)
MWGEFKSRFGWNPKAFMIDWAGESIPLLVISRRLAPGVSFAYIPWLRLPKTFFSGVMTQELDNNFNQTPTKALAELADKLKPFLARNTAFVRFDPSWNLEKGADKEFISAGFKRAAAAVQAPDTVVIELAATCDEILAAMKPKCRYNISVAEKKGVKVTAHEQFEQGLEKFYDLLKETAARDGIAIHSFEYYKTLFEICKRRKQDGENLPLRLYTAEHEGDTLAAIIVLFYGREATYLYGASSNVKRNLMATYMLQWKAIQDAKAAGCQSYDLFGIPPDDNPNHPMAGLYRFKTGFGGKIIHRPGSWDYPYKRSIYLLFNIAEALRKKIRDRKKKR